MPTTNFRATVNATGDKLHAQDKSALHSALAPHASQEVVVTVDTYDPATRGLRRYYFAAVVEAVRNHLSQGRELPLSKDQTHELLKKAFLGIEQTALGEVAKSTKGMNQVELWDYIESICSHAASEWGVQIPLPNE